MQQIQKKPSRRVLKRSCSEIMLQIYRRAPMPKCDLNKVGGKQRATLLKSHFGMGVLS